MSGRLIRLSLSLQLDRSVTSNTNSCDFHTVARLQSKIRAGNVFLTGWIPRDLYGQQARCRLEVTKQHRVFNGLHFTELNAGDISVVFFRDRDKSEQIRIAMADGRCFSRMNLGEFCELMYAVQKEIRDRHWQETSTMDDVLDKLYPPSVPATE